MFKSKTEINLLAYDKKSIFSKSQFTKQLLNKTTFFDFHLIPLYNLY